MAERILFITGRLAAPSLRRILDGINDTPEAGFQCDLCEMPISVAALMTPAWALERIRALGLLERFERPDRILIPGRCAGDLRVLAEGLGVLVERGPEELWDIPAFMGLDKKIELQAALEGPKIIAEIVDAWRMSPDEILAKAEKFRNDGADYIDLGGNPDSGVPDVEWKIAALKEKGHLVSVDTFHRETLFRAGTAGADLLLSVNSSNAALLDRVDCPVVVVPDYDEQEQQNHIASLERNMELVRGYGNIAIADPILAPPLMGFVLSLHRFAEYRNLHPDVPMMMGTGNVTELTEADSTGMNALLAACAAEIGVNYILTTEVAEWAAGTVRELSLACGIMQAALSNNVLPRHISDGLRPLKKRGSKYTIGALRVMQEAITDENWRIFVAEGKICVFNRDRFLCGDEIGVLFKKMGIEDAAHAFYVGVELQKAEIACRLDRNYVQDDDMSWGVLS